MPFKMDVASKGIYTSNGTFILTSVEPRYVGITHFYGILMDLLHFFQCFAKEVCSSSFVNCSLASHKILSV